MGFLADEQAFDFKELDVDNIEGGVPKELQRVWVSKLYVVRYYNYDGNERLSIDYVITELNDNTDVIRWDHLQKIKNTLGFADRYAVELFPPEEETIHAIAQRHLWLIGEPDFGLGKFEKE